MPGLAYAIYRKPGQVYDNRVLERVTQAYHELLETPGASPASGHHSRCRSGRARDRPRRDAGPRFPPVSRRGDSIWLQVEMPPGISLAKGSEMAAELRGVVRTFPEVSYVVTQLGRNEDGTDPWTPSHIEAAVGLKPYDEWGGDKQALIRRMDARFHTMPGYQIGFSQPMIDGVEDMIAGAHSRTRASRIRRRLHGDAAHRRTGARRPGRDPRRRRSGDRSGAAAAAAANRRRPRGGGPVRYQCLRHCRL